MFRCVIFLMCNKCSYWTTFFPILVDVQKMQSPTNILTFEIVQHCKGGSKIQSNAPTLLGLPLRDVIWCSSHQFWGRKFWYIVRLLMETASLFHTPQYFLMKPILESNIGEVGLTIVFGIGPSIFSMSQKKELVPHPTLKNSINTSWVKATVTN